MACLVFISAIFIGSQDCTYNEVHPFVASVTWGGPIFSAGYYPVGSSPFETGTSTPECDDRNNMPVIPCPQPGDAKADFGITGTVTIDDLGTPCDADDTITATIALDAATRAATGGGEGRLEETWGDGDVVFNMAATTVSTATPNGGGCDYVIASQGMPPLLQQGGVDDYPADDTGNGSPGFWDASTPVAMASWNPGPQFGPIDETNCVAPGGATPPGCDGTGNVGAEILVTVGPSWSCTEIDTDTPQCVADPDGGSTFVGSRSILENTLVSVSIDAAGDITAARMFANNEGKTLDSAPLYENTWDGAVLDFTGTCNNCAGGAAVAGDDGPYPVLQGSLNNSLNTGANDTGWTDPATITLNAAPDNGGTATPAGTPGDATLVTFDYTPALAFSGVETFTYDVNDGVNPAATATVTVNVEADNLPVANPGTGPDISTQGVAPDSVSGDLDITTIAGNELGNAPSTVTAVTAGASDAGACSANGTTVTFTPDAATFVGTGVCDYTIEDTQMDMATSTVTFDIPNALPAITDTSAGESVADEPVTVDLTAAITLGNGDAAQNPLTVSTDATDGSCTLTGNDLTYTPDAGFSGPDECTVTITDGNLDTADAVIDFLIAAGQSTVGLPGGSSATDLWTLSMLLGLPLLRRRRRS
jgi:hypothetical protein